MLQKVKMQGVNLPRLYIAETREDVRMAIENGLPYIVWKTGMESLIKAILAPMLKSMFPEIRWDKVLGNDMRRVQSKVTIVSSGTDEREAIPDDSYDAEAMLAAQHAHDVDSTEKAIERTKALPDGIVLGEENFTSTGYRDITGNDSHDGYETFEEKLSIYDYVGDISASVSIDVLMDLGLLPRFLGDIADCIRTNLSNSMAWREGYTKKLDATLGKFERKAELPNLIILDISNSIPDGIVATMVTLIDTLRNNCNAELIITSRRSGYYPANVKLPTPQTIFDYYGRCNEGAEFYGILNRYISGREFGHVFSFGDNDSPGRHTSSNLKIVDTKVNKVHHFHVDCIERRTGYALWCHQCSPQAEEVFDKDWCKVIKP